jgi:hypothetical protein
MFPLLMSNVLPSRTTDAITFDVTVNVEPSKVKLGSAFAAITEVDVITRVADAFAIFNPGPVIPVGPVAPVAPVIPVGPVNPVMPVGPVTSDAAPVIPVGPVGPVAPAPVGPVTVDGAPIGPVFPVGPVAPVFTANPAGP